MKDTTGGDECIKDMFTSTILMSLTPKTYLFPNLWSGIRTWACRPGGRASCRWRPGGWHYECRPKPSWEPTELVYTRGTYLVSGHLLSAADVGKTVVELHDTNLSDGLSGLSFLVRGLGGALGGLGGLLLLSLVSVLLEVSGSLGFDKWLSVDETTDGEGSGRAYSILNLSSRLLRTVRRVKSL